MSLKKAYTTLKGLIMRSLPERSISGRPLLDMVNGQIKTQLLLTAIKLRIFNYLEEFSTPESIAGLINTHPGNTMRFLDTLAMIDLVEKKNGRYRNRPITSVHLVEDSPHYMGRMLDLIKRMSLDPLANIEEMVTNGPIPPTEAGDISNEELWASAAKDSAVWVYGEVGHMVAGIVSGLPGAEDMSRMLDLGGGHGMFALYIVSSSPVMKGIVFDRAPIVTVAQSFINDYGLQDRVSVQAGNYLTDDIGSGYDLIWASATLNFAKDNLDALINKIFSALNPGGYFISFQDGLTNEKTKPDTMLGHSIDMLRIGEDFSFTQGEIADAMVRCGFSTVRSKTIDTPMGAMDMDIARKRE